MTMLATATRLDMLVSPGLARSPTMRLKYHPRMRAHQRSVSPGVLLLTLG